MMVPDGTQGMMQGGMAAAGYEQAIGGCMGGYDASSLAAPSGAEGGLNGGVAVADPMAAVGDLSALDGNTAAMMAMQGAMEASAGQDLGGGAAAGAGAEAIEARIEAFCATYGLNHESRGVLQRLNPEAQETVMSQFSPKGVSPGSYEMNGKLIMFARNVERSYKGQKGPKGKGDSMGKGMAAPAPPAYGAGGYGAAPGGCAPAAYGCPAGGCMPSVGFAAAGPGYAPQASCGGWDDWSGKGGCCGDYGCSQGMGGWAGKGGQDWGKGGGYGAWKGGKGEYQTTDMWGGGSYGAAPGGYGADPSGAGYMEGMAGEVQLPPGTLEEFIGKWGLNEDAKVVLYSLAPAVQQTVMEQFRGGDVGGVNGRFIVFARGVEKGRKGASKGGCGPPRIGPY